jgi:hypothetical protein
MNLPDHHARYFAHELSPSYASDSLEKLAGARYLLIPHDAIVRRLPADAFQIRS